MSSSALPFDPYRPPDEVLAEPAQGGRTGGLITICVLAIVLGCLGLCNGLFTGGALVVGKQMQQTFQPQQPPGMKNDLFEAQKEMQDEINAVADQFLPANIVIVVVRFTIATMLIVGGLLSLGLKPTGRNVLLAALVCGLAFEVGRTAVESMIQMRSLAAMDTYMKKMIGAGPQGGNPQQAQQAQEIVKVSMKIGIVLGFALVGIIVSIKMFFYSISLYYLTRPPVKMLFYPTFPSGPPPGKS